MFDKDEPDMTLPSQRICGGLLYCRLVYQHVLMWVEAATHRGAGTLRLLAMANCVGILLISACSSPDREWGYKLIDDGNLKAAGIHYALNGVGSVVLLASHDNLSLTAMDDAWPWQQFDVQHGNGQMSRVYVPHMGKKDIQIDGTTYSLKNGAVFLFDTSETEVRVTQMDITPRSPNDEPLQQWLEMKRQAAATITTEH